VGGAFLTVSRGQARGQPRATILRVNRPHLRLKIQGTDVSIVDTLRRICELQPRYSSDNTAEMKERGNLIRHTLADQIRDLSPRLKPALANFGDELGVDASDGIGRKTEAPWVRFCNLTMSPDARTGFYSVNHFTADGTAAFITVGCGATQWTNGELRPFSDEDLASKTSGRKTSSWSDSEP